MHTLMSACQENCLMSQGEVTGVVTGVVSPAYCSILWNQMIFKTKSDKTRD
jgi:hypothetical protein